MDENKKTYIAIDLKSFYASVECIERGLNPLNTNLVVADASRTEKTICLAVSPSMKSYGIPGRPRLFEVSGKIKEVNAERRIHRKNKKALNKSFSCSALSSNPLLDADYIVATPRMALYMKYSTKIYNIYLKYIAPESIHVYSIDEVFMDVTNYLKTYNKTARGLAMTMIQDVLKSTGITATAGIGPNLYLCKIAMDIVAKHIPCDKDGVRIAELDEMTYRRELWDHRPLTDFWRVGRGYSAKLEKNGLYTMGDIARCSLNDSSHFHSEDLLYKLFGVNAELLIDHAWGWEPCTMEDIKAYKPSKSSIGSGQVLSCPYVFEKAKLVMKEMADSLALDLSSKKLLTDQLVITVGYDIENMKSGYKGISTTDRYGRRIPKHGHGTINLIRPTSSTKAIIDAAMSLFDRITDKNLLIRRLYITAGHVTKEGNDRESYEQISLFTNSEDIKREEKEREKEKRLQEAIIAMRKKYGKNSVLKGINYEPDATGKERNNQIGGHKA